MSGGGFGMSGTYLGMSSQIGNGVLFGKLLETKTLTGASATVSFTGLSGYLVYLVMGTFKPSANCDMTATINADTGNHYTWVRVRYSGVAATVDSAAGVAQVNIGECNLNNQSLVRVYVGDMTSSAKPVWGGVNKGGSMLSEASGEYSETAAVSSIQLTLTSGNFPIGSRFLIYGVI